MRQKKVHLRLRGGIACRADLSKRWGSTVVTSTINIKKVTCVRCLWTNVRDGDLLEGAPLKRIKLDAVEHEGRTIVPLKAGRGRWWTTDKDGVMFWTGSKDVRDFAHELMNDAHGDEDTEQAAALWHGVADLIEELEEADGT